MDEVIKFVNGSEVRPIRLDTGVIKFFVPENPELFSERRKGFMTEEDMKMMWYLKEVYVNELQST